MKKEKFILPQLNNVSERKNKKLDINNLAALKVNYYLPEGTSMYDRSACAANCSKNCARKHVAAKCFTCSDLTKICSEYTPIN